MGFRGHRTRVKNCFAVELLAGFNLAELPRDDRVKRLPRDTDTLLPIIQRFIRPGSIIYSDGWGAYHSLSNNGYTHKTVIHEHNFINPEDPDVHTQTIEQM